VSVDPNSGAGVAMPESVPGTEDLPKPAAVWPRVCRQALQGDVGVAGVHTPAPRDPAWERMGRTLIPAAARNRLRA
jgi:hypothetical protein